MTLNGITCIGYQRYATGFTAILVDTDREQILNICTASLDIAANDGMVIESFTGFAAPNELRENLDEKTWTVTFPPANRYEQHLNEVQQRLEAENARLRADNERLQAQAQMLQMQQTFLEDCLLEMADVVYA